MQDAEDSTKILSENNTSEAIFSALLPALCNALQCDRYLRYPQTNIGKVVSCWCRICERLPNLDRERR
jgi:hypothetical protein